MTTQSFPPNSTKTDVGAPADPPAGDVLILMKTNRYYTTGTLLQTGRKYVVTAAWGKLAEERGWGKVVDNPQPAANRPAEPTLASKAYGLRKAFRTDALVKIFGPTDLNGYTFNAPSGNLPFDWSNSIKQEVEAPFSAVRLVVWNRMPTALTFKALVGVTETADNSTATLRTAPRIGGVSYEQLAPGVTANGFKTVTFSGSGTVVVPAANLAHQLSISDRIAISSVPRAVNEASSRPLLLTRVYSPGASVLPWMPSNIDYLTAGNGPALLGGRIYAMSSGGGDYVGAPNVPVPAAGSTVCIEYAQILTFNTPVLSVWGVGDSIMNLPAVITQSLYINTWGQRACAEVSTSDRPVVWANMGAPVAGAAKYLALARQYLAAGCPAPSVLVINPISTNDDSSNWVTAGANGMEKAREWALDAIRLAREYDIPYIVWFPMLMRENATAASDALRKQLNAEMQTIAAAQGIFWLDVSAVGNGASLELFKSIYSYGDGLHQNERANTEIFVPALSAALRVILG